MSTEDVLNHHLQAFGSGDIDELIKDYTKDSVLMTSDGRLTGPDEIRPAFEGFFSGLFRPGSYEFTMDRMDIEGDIAFIAWHSSNEGAEVPLGTDTFVIRNGKIAMQTFAVQVNTT